MSNNKIILSQGLQVDRDLRTVLDQITRKLNAVDALTAATATAEDIVKALQK